MHKPTREELLAAAGKAIPDVIAHDLKVLFCGINPGLYSGATGHHFARPGNRFWPALHGAGFTPRRLDPSAKEELLKAGYGITTLVPRTTVSADELTVEEPVTGRKRLEALTRRDRPRVVAVLGVGAYRTGFAQPRAALGRQPVDFAGATLWVLPNPSGLNANHQLADLIVLFRALRRHAVRATQKRRSV